MFENPLTSKAASDSRQKHRSRMKRIGDTVNEDKAFWTESDATTMQSGPRLLSCGGFQNMFTEA